jgi:glucose-fructose oxidoreductase
MDNSSGPTRRSFLTGALALSVPALIGLSSRRALASDHRANGKLGVVLIGLGGFSTASIAPELASAKNVYFAGVVTGDPKGKGRKFAAQYGFPEKNIYTYEQIPRLADNPGIDIVHVATPNGLHAAHAIAAAQAGKHVMCEKPMATSSAECRAMIDAARKAGVHLGVNYRLHFEPHHLEMMRLAKEKVYGDLKSIDTEFSWRRGPRKPWLSDKKLAGGGAMFDTGVYCIQAGCYMTGATPIALTAVPATTGRNYPPGIEESMSVVLEYPGEVVMHGRATYQYGRQQFVVNADKGTFACVGSSFGQSVNGRPAPKEIALPGDQKFKRPDTLQLAVLHDQFAEAIRTKRAFACPGEMGLRDIWILEAVYDSVAQGSRRMPVSFS